MGFNVDFRPNDFEDIIGNDSIVLSLKNLLNDKNLIPHTFLFHGKTGCGKTTLARILAKNLNCSQYDLIEINASNNRGIDTVRDIMNQMVYKPIDGDVKVYILDEIHQATKDFQNGILKALEDMPNHVYFILCTTEPERLLPTVRNRCVQFSVDVLERNQIIDLLNNVLIKLNKEVSKEILDKISVECDGIPRQALLMLQQVIDIQDIDKAIELLSTIKSEEKQIIDLCRAILKGESWTNTVVILKNLNDDAEKIRRAILGYFSNVALNSKNMKMVMKAGMVMEYFSGNYYDSGRAGLILSCLQSLILK